MPNIHHLYDLICMCVENARVEERSNERDTELGEAHPPRLPLHNQTFPTPNLTNAKHSIPLLSFFLLCIALRY